MSDFSRLVVGCMTGTSIDALDTALVRILGRGVAMRAEMVRTRSRPLGALGPRLRSLADQHPMTAGQIATLAHEFALFHAATIADLLDGEDPPDLIAVHGQTVFHAPPVSWQMFNGAVLAHELNVPVVFDLRAADLAAGGQGAPITPLADWILFRSALPTAVLNLGGFANATLLPASEPGSDPSAAIDAIQGFDICACNHLLDRIARELLGRPFDEGGAIALSGTAHPGARDDLALTLSSQSRAGRSLGTGDETARWLDRWRAECSPSDLGAAACEAIAGAITPRLADVRAILVAGGGAHNGALVRAIEQHSGTPIAPTSSRGVPIEFREAAEMAVLGALCQDRVPITLARVTGVPMPAPIAGVWAGL